ncbi:MAG: helix-turn-helix domain-containing protein [Bradymonadales bacterium]|nr:helix-turn-helix domain-containing protein [Bradymonadales bacterium]
MYTVARISEILDLHPKTVRRFIREGKIKATRIGREWRISKADLRQYTHAELANTPDEPRPATPLSSRVQVSAVIELSDGHSEEVSRISNSLIAVLNSKDPSWGTSRYDLLYHPETHKARFVLNGTPLFIRTLLELVEVLIQEGGTVDG